MDAPIQQLVPPVVIISACGLLCMGQFARYTAIVGRARQFHREFLAAYRQLRHAAPEDRALYEAMCRELEQQAQGVLRLAGLIRSALLYLVAAVIFMILASLLIGVELVWPRLSGIAAITAFVVGLFCMLVGMVYVFAEVRVSLRLVHHEHDELQTRAELFTPARGSEP
ncbi:MAG: DUF2721 domain-containing protein [Planctomycetota bacterium]